MFHIETQVVRTRRQNRFPSALRGSTIICRIDPKMLAISVSSQSRKLLDYKADAREARTAQEQPEQLVYPERTEQQE